MIRNATAQDAQAIADLWRPWVDETTITFNSKAKSPEEVAAMIAARPAFKLAFDGDSLLGFATYDQFRGGIGYAKSMEHTIILSPKALGKGAGRALMSAIEEDARQKGHRIMVAGVSGENPKARAFHEAIGYQLWGTIPQAGYKFGRYIDLWLLGKTL